MSATVSALASSRYRGGDLANISSLHISTPFQPPLGRKRERHSLGGKICRQFECPSLKSKNVSGLQGISPTGLGGDVSIQRLDNLSAGRRHGRWSRLTVRQSVAGADEWNVREEIQNAFDQAGSGSELASTSSNGTVLGNGGEGGVLSKDAEEAVKAGGPQGMAEAFSISKRTAFGVTTAIAFAALLMPLFMGAVAAGVPLKTRVLSYATLLVGFYMAWNIGANDVANAMGTSVGSGALSLRQAVLTAAVLEFAGAYLVGSHVSHTMQNGILAVAVFEKKPALHFAGMVSSLAAAGTWLQVASYFGWPVSTTHCIIGAMVGFGLVYAGFGAVYWKSLARVVSSWVISPFMGAAVSFIVYLCIRKFVYSSPNPGQAAATAAPIAVFVGVAALSFTAFPSYDSILLTVAQALGFGVVGGIIINAIIKRELGNLLGEYCATDSQSSGSKPPPSSPLRLAMNVGGPTGTQLRIVYSIFGYLQVLSACFMSFAHGANDVANAIGPISAALAILHGTSLVGEVGMATDVLIWGGFGIVSGLMVWGYRVIATIGNKITELTPTRGFAAEFAAASVVVIASRLGLPISATHTLVGAVMGVGFARGFSNVRGEVVKEIVASWVVTIPVGALLSVLYTYLVTKIVPALT